MTLGSLVLLIGAIAFILTLVRGFLYKSHKSWLLTFLQNFTGVLFIFSGFVKALDPWGTAYKMQQYFAEFDSLFSDSWLSFASGIFPFLSNYSLAFSIIMIIFEIVLGIMLLLGSRSKFTSWAFLLLVLFFTVLTGFTYLTGYVPPDATFFEFGKWGDYNELQMKVTDCGCFGDFLKLKPKISFFKDVFLLVPAFIFVFRHRDMHQLFNRGFRSTIITASIFVLLIYCLRNSVWTLPHADLRPFKEGVDVVEQKAAEEEAEANIEIIGWKLKNKESNQVIELSNAVYMKEYASYPKEEWTVIEQIKTEPSIPKTKISEFLVYGENEEDATYEVLHHEGYSFWYICDKLRYNGSTVEEHTYIDTVITQFEGDTIINGELLESPEITDFVQRKENVVKYFWDKDYLERFRKSVIPFMQEAHAASIPNFLMVGGAGAELAKSFAEDIEAPVKIYTADDILLKTIIRSNPGIVLVKDGVIVKKWHFRKLPSFEFVSEEFIY